jgi:hypothetical protein
MRWLILLSYIVRKEDIESIYIFIIHVVIMTIFTHDCHEPQNASGVSSVDQKTPIYDMLDLSFFKLPRAPFPYSNALVKTLARPVSSPT